MTAKSLVKFTANFERNLKELDAFLVQAQAPHAFDALLDEFMAAVTPASIAGNMCVIAQTSAFKDSLAWIQALKSKPITVF